MTITLAKIFQKFAEYQRAAAAKSYYPHCAIGAMEGMTNLINGNKLTESQAKDILRVCRDFCDTMEMMDLEEWLKDEHDMIILMSEL